MDIDKEKQHVPVGRVVVTPGALAALIPEAAVVWINRHARGDWGDLPEEDRRLNDAALQNGDRVLSSYTDDNGTKFWIITEADRSATTILLPDEY